MEWDPTRIPDFVWRRLPEGDLGVPLLLFHWLSPEALKERLGWLQRAGYRTLSGREIEAIARGRSAVPRRAVGLTFDDGVYNNWAVVAPMLRRYGFTAIAFVVPRLLTEGEPRPTLEDHEAGRISREALLDDRAQGRYLRWSEAIALDREGVLEIESHTWDHAQVFVTDEIVDFQHPLPDGSPRYPWLWSACGVEPDEPLWGAPVYRLAPRMVGRRYHDHPGLRDACRNFVTVRGERGFFADSTWFSELTHMVARERPRFGPGRFETPEETDRARLFALRRAREVLGERLGRDIRQVALPWSRGAPDAPRLIDAAGYRIGYVSERPSWRLDGSANPLALSRVEGYWLESLPGPERVSLARRVAARLRRQRSFVSR